MKIEIFFQQKSILCVRLLENGTLLTGGLDGKLATWDANKYFNTPLQEMQVSRNHGLYIEFFCFLLLLDSYLLQERRGTCLHVGYGNHFSHNHAFSLTLSSEMNKPKGTYLNCYSDVLQSQTE